MRPTHERNTSGGVSSLRAHGRPGRFLPKPEEDHIVNVSDGTGVHSVDPDSEDVPDEPDWAEPSVRNHLCLVLDTDDMVQACLLYTSRCV